MQVLIYLALVLIGIYELIKYLVNQSKGRGGAQYQELQNLVASALPGESGVQVVYGNYETTDASEYTTRIRRTTYYRYAIAFRSDCLWIAPLGFEKRTNRMVLAAPLSQIRPDELGMVTANANQKRSTLVLTLYRKDQSKLIRCDVLAENRRNNRFRRVNIHQPEACEALCEQMTLWAERVNRENTALQSTWKAKAAKPNKPAGLVLGVVSLVFSLVVAPVTFALGNIGLSVLTGPFGLLMALIGLLKTRAAKKAGLIVPKAYIMLLIVAIVVSLLNLGFWSLHFTMAPPPMPPVG